VSNYCEYSVTPDINNPDYYFPGKKIGFCIQSTNRIINARGSTTWSNYQTCSYQGVNPGWADNYNAGITGQWVTITSLDTSHGAIEPQLEILGNPKHWLCEGVINRNPDGSIQWVNANAITVTPPWPIPGLPIEIFNCTISPGALDNNDDYTTFEVPKPGGGLLTSTCLNEGQVFGHERDCEFTKQDMMIPCTPGAQVTVHCSHTSQHSQVVRLCESSIALNTGTACRFNDPWLLANAIVLPYKKTKVSFSCPTKRDSVEVGGFYSMYSGVLFNGVDSQVPITCHE